MTGASFVPVLLILFLAAITIGVLAFEIWMFVNAIQNPELSPQERALWCVGMVLIHPFVAILYFFTRYSRH